MPRLMASGAGRNLRVVFFGLRAVARLRAPSSPSCFFLFIEAQSAKLFFILFLMKINLDASSSARNRDVSRAFVEPD